MDKITKLPWKFGDSKGYSSEKGRYIIYAEHLGFIADCNSKEDAEYICRAVNSHEGLVELIHTARLLLISQEQQLSFVQKKIYDQFMFDSKEALKATDGEGVK